MQMYIKYIASKINPVVRLNLPNSNAGIMEINDNKRHTGISIKMLCLLTGRLPP